MYMCVWERSYYKAEGRKKPQIIHDILEQCLKTFKTNLEKVSATELPEGPNYVSTRSFFKENKKL